MCVLRSHGHGVHDDHRPVVGHEGRQLQPIAGEVRAEDQGHGSVFVQCIRVVSQVDGVCHSVSYVVVADPMASSGRVDPQVGFRRQGIVPRNSYERPSSSRAGTTRYESVRVGPCPLELEIGRAASRLGIRNMVLATVSRGQRDPHASIAAWANCTVNPCAFPPAVSVSTAATTSSRQASAAGLRPPR